MESFIYTLLAGLLVWDATDNTKLGAAAYFALAAICRAVEKSGKGGRKS